MKARKRLLSFLVEHSKLINAESAGKLVNITSMINEVKQWKNDL